MTDLPRLRSVLYVPADNERALAKAASLPADGFIFDLEDAVDSLQRQETTENLARFLETFDAQGRYCLIRLSRRQDYAAELVSFLHLETIQGFVLPKMENKRDILTLQSALNSTGKHIWVMVETARGLYHLPSILDDLICRNLKGLIVGSNDLMVETGLDMQKDETLAKALLAPLVLGARAHNLAALDGVWNAFGDTGGFAAACRLGRYLGFDGKTLIHPSQIDAANAIFAPTEEELSEARAIVDAFELPENAGRGVISIEGRMRERLHLEWARRMLRGE